MLGWIHRSNMDSLFTGKNCERVRPASNSQNEKYTKMFEPITRSTCGVNHHTHYTLNDNLIKFTGDPATLLDGGYEVVENLPQTLLLTKNEEERYRLKKSQSLLLQQTLARIPIKVRDDGVFGLDAWRKVIGNKPHTVGGRDSKCCKR